MELNKEIIPKFIEALNHRIQQRQEWISGEAEKLLSHLINDKRITLMELKYNDVFFHINTWYWGHSVDIVKTDGTAIVCVKFDEKSFPKAGYICDLSILETERKKGIGWVMMQYAINTCRDYGMTFARLHVDAKNIWLKEWYERLGFKELSRDENELEMIREL